MVKTGQEKHVKSMLFRVRLFPTFRGPGVGALAGTDQKWPDRFSASTEAEKTTFSCPVYGFCRDFPLKGVVAIIPWHIGI